MLQSYYKLQQKPISVPELKDAIEVLWSTLPKKAIENSVKDYRYVCWPKLYIVNMKFDNSYNRKTDTN